MISRTSLILAGLAATLAAPALAGPDYSPSKRGQYPSTNFNAPDADRITLHGTGSTGEIPAMTVGGAPLASLLASVPQIANGTVRLLGGPTLGLWQAGRYTATPDALTTPGTVSAGALLGDGSAIGVVPSTAAAAGSLARLLADRVTAANPAMSGNLTHTGVNFSLGNGALGNTSQPENAYLDMIAPNDRYHDNVLTIENRSVRPGTGACGNAAIRFRDPTLGVERAAVGWSRLSSCADGYYPNTLYMEGGNIGPANDPYATDLAWIMTEVPGAKYFPGSSYCILWAQASTNFIRMTNSKGITSHEFDTEGYFTTLYGPAGGNAIQFSAAAAGTTPRLLVLGGDTNVGLNILTKGTGTLLLNGTPLPLSTTQNTWSQAQTFGNGIRVTGGNVSSGQYTFNSTDDQMLFSDGSGGVTLRTGTGGNDFYFTFRANGNLETQRTIAATSFSANGTAGASCNGAPTASFKVVGGIVTAC